MSFPIDREGLENHEKELSVPEFGNSLVVGLARQRRGGGVKKINHRGAHPPKGREGDFGVHSITVEDYKGK